MCVCVCPICLGCVRVRVDSAYGVWVLMLCLVCARVGFVFGVGCVRGVRAYVCCVDSVFGACVESAFGVCLCGDFVLCG